MSFIAKAIRDVETSMLFFPQPQLRGNPEHLGLAYEDVWLTAADGIRIHAWFIRGTESPRTDSPRLAMLMTHGNGGNISVRLDQYAEFIRRFQTIDILSLSYRGYGESEGEPSEEGFALDAEAAYRWLRQTIDLSSAVKVFFGRSLGGAVAARLAAKHRPEALVLECAPSSIPYLAERMTMWRFFPLDKVIINRFDTEAYMKDVRCPVLMMHSELDEIVPFECSKLNLAAANEPKRFYTIPDAPHNGADLIDPDGYYAAIRDFLTKFTAWVGEG